MNFLVAAALLSLASAQNPACYDSSRWNGKCWGCVSIYGWCGWGSSYCASGTDCTYSSSMPAFAGRAGTFPAVAQPHTITNYSPYNSAIGDGGSWRNDIYDTGNQISINGGNYLIYGDGCMGYTTAVSNSGSFSWLSSYEYAMCWNGADIQVADFFSATKEMTSFSVDGNLGADGSGGRSTHGPIIGAGYTGWAVQVYGAGDPTLTKIMVTPTADGWTCANYGASTDLEDWRCSGSGTDSIVYMMLAGKKRRGPLPTTTLESLMQWMWDGRIGAFPTTEPTNLPTMAPTEDPTSVPTNAPTVDCLSYSKKDCKKNPTAKAYCQKVKGRCFFKNVSDCAMYNLLGSKGKKACDKDKNLNCAWNKSTNTCAPFQCSSFSGRNSKNCDAQSPQCAYDAATKTCIDNTDCSVASSKRLCSSMVSLGLNANCVWQSSQCQDVGAAPSPTPNPTAATPLACAINTSKSACKAAGCKWKGTLCK